MADSVLKIRPAACSDGVAIAPLMSSLFPQPFDPIELQDRLSKPETICVVAHRDDVSSGTLIGFALGQAVLDECELQWIGVIPEARGHGCGGRLLSAFEAGAVARGAIRFVLEVAADNAAARRLYTHTGYDPVGRRRGYYSAGRKVPVDALILSKILAR